LAADAVLNSGLDDRVGPIAVDLIDTNLVAHLESGLVDVVRSWLADVAQSAAKLLEQNEVALQNIANDLFGRESLTADQIIALFTDSCDLKIGALGHSVDVYRVE